MQTDSIKKVEYFPFRLGASRFVKAGLLFCLVFFPTVFAAGIDAEITEIKQAKAEFDNGNYLKAIEIANESIEKARKIKNSVLISEGLDIKAISEISLEKYDEAAKTLDEALDVLSDSQSQTNQKALIYIHYAWLFRSQRKFPASFDYSKKAIAVEPESRYILAGHYLNTGRISFASGYDVSAIIWLEKAEKLLESEKASSVKLETYRFLSLAWSSKLNYQKALEYAEKGVLYSDKTQFKYKHRQALFDLQTIAGSSGQEKRALNVLEKGLKLSLEEDNSYQAAKFASSLLLHALDAGDVDLASGYLSRLEKLSTSSQFSFEIKLGRAVIAAFKNEPEVAEKTFAEIEKEEKPSEYALPYWKIIVCEKKHDWEQLIKINQALLDLTLKDNYRDGLPKIYLTFAKAYFSLKQTEAAIENLEKCLSYIEELRESENYNLSLGLSENYHDAYRLLAQIKVENPQESFELADFLKARLLKDKINNSSYNSVLIISEEVRRKLEELSLKYIEDQSLASEIQKIEKTVTAKIPELNLAKPNLSELDKIPELNDKAIISYFFTLDKKLTAFVWEKDKPLRSVTLPVSEDDIEFSARTTEKKIKNLIFFKRDGKEIYDKLLKPLNVKAKPLPSRNKLAWAKSKFSLARKIL